MAASSFVAEDRGDQLVPVIQDLHLLREDEIAHENSVADLGQAGDIHDNPLRQGCGHAFNLQLAQTGGDHAKKALIAGASPTSSTPTLVRIFSVIEMAWKSRWMIRFLM